MRNQTKLNHFDLKFISTYKVNVKNKIGVVILRQKEDDE